MTNNGTRVKKTGNKEWNACVLGVEGNQFKVKLNSQAKNLLIGFGPRTVNLNGSNYSTCGYYLSTHAGALYSQNGHSGTSYASKIRLDRLLKVNLKMETFHSL